MQPSDHPHYPITVQTCEDHNHNECRRPLVPDEGEPATLFRLDDPFGLRKAIVPIFHADDTDILTGMGTAFALDPWGNFLSADHVTDFLRQGAVEQSGEIAIPGGAHALALLGMGLIFGEVGIPREALIQMIGTRTPMIPVDDPMNFTGRQTTRPYDVTFLNTASAPSERMLQNLPIRRQVRRRVLVIGLRRDIADAFRMPPTFPGRRLNVGEALVELMAANGWEGAREWARQRSDQAVLDRNGEVVAYGAQASTVVTGSGKRRRNGQAAQQAMVQSRAGLKMSKDQPFEFIARLMHGARDRFGLIMPLIYFAIEDALETDSSEVSTQNWIEAYARLANCGDNDVENVMHADNWRSIIRTVDRRGNLGPVMASQAKGNRGGK